MPRRRRQLDVRASCVVPDVLDVVGDQIQRLPLLMDHVRHIAEQLVELRHGLLDVPDLRLALDDERLLEVDLVLRREPQLLLLLLLLRVLAPDGRRRLRGLFVERGAAGGGGGALLVDGGALQVLELLE
jgi:hypothetical protein